MPVAPNTEHALRGPGVGRRRGPHSITVIVSFDLADTSDGIADFDADGLTIVNDNFALLGCGVRAAGANTHRRNTTDSPRRDLDLRETSGRPQAA